MKARYSRSLAVALLFTLAACSEAPNQPSNAPAEPSQESSAPTVRDVMKIEGFSPLEAGTYFIDPDADASTPLRVVYDVPAEGWSQWIGAVKFVGDELVGVSITTVENVVRQACSNHSPADPPVGPSVDDLATALADLAPFDLTSPPKNVNIYGYHGKHLELTVPDMPVSHEGFTGCLDDNLYSWMSPQLGPRGDNAFYGYTGPGYREEIWILDVGETRLMIAAGRSPGMPSGDFAEQRTILDSIRIEP